MRILVTFAVDAEFAPWRKLRKFASSTSTGCVCGAQMRASTEITSLVTGMGAQSAAKAMDLMMRLADQDQHFDICISSGLAGALEEGLSPCDIIAPQLLISENRHADLPQDQISVDPELRQQAVEGGAKVADCLLTVDRVLVKQSHKRSCASRAQSVDMESFEIVKEACAWGARCVVIRAISDSAQEDLPINFNLTLSKNHQVSVAKVLVQLAKNPLALPALVRFGRQSQKAATRLAAFLDGYILGLESTGTKSRASEADSAMSGTGTVVEQARTIGANTQDHACGGVPGEGNCARRGSACAGGGRRRSAHQGGGLRDLRYGYQEDLPALRGTATNSRARAGGDGGGGWTRSHEVEAGRPCDELSPHPVREMLSIAKTGCSRSASNTRPPG